jgi:hypothetical protein
MIKYIHNNSGITKAYLGTEIPDGSFYQIPVLEDVKYAENDELIADIASGDVAMSIDGAVDLSIVDSAIFLQYRNECFEQRFRSEPERANGFSSVNAQEAIEEARGDGSLIGRCFKITYISNGNTGNKWLFLGASAEASNDLPFHSPFDLSVYGIAMNNRLGLKRVDIEFYKNGALFYTMEVNLPVNQTHAHIVVSDGIFMISDDDELSVFVRKVGGDALASPTVDVFCRITTNNSVDTGVL